MERTASTRLIAAYYVVLALAVAAAAAIVLSTGDDEHARPSIAGGYDATVRHACLGPSFDVAQSGEFVNLSNTRGTLGAKLRLEDEGELSGDVDCADGRTLRFDGEAAAGDRGIITGHLGGMPVSAELKRDPPEPGAAKPRAPGSIDGLYRLSPRSACLGGRLEIDPGELDYDSDTGAVSGEVECARGGTARLRALAVDRNLNDLELDPPGERVTATKQRESFGLTVAAFFIAVAVVMLVARLFGALAVRSAQPRVMGEVVAGITLGPTILGWISPEPAGDAVPLRHPAGVRGRGEPRPDLLHVPGRARARPEASSRAAVAQAAAISNTSVALPMILGIAVALPLYPLRRRPTRSSSRSPCSWAWRCRSRRSPCSRGSSSSGGCSSGRSARSRSRARRSTTSPRGS